MKGRSFIVAVAVGAFLAAFAGISQAGETGRSVDEGAEYRTYNAFDTAEHWGPVEVGALPGQETKGRIVQEEIVIDPSEMGKPTAE